MEPRMRSGKNNTVMQKRLRTVCPAGADYFFALHEPLYVLIYRANQGTQIFGNETLEEKSRRQTRRNGHGKQWQHQVRCRNPWG